jgi:uncharacterized protein YndB with AHSA1/START domain
MPAMTAQATQVYTVFIRATAEQIWEAITKPEFTVQYFFGNVFDSTWHKGASIEVWSSDRSVKHVEGEVLESDPPRLLQSSWRDFYNGETADDQMSRVTWEIEPQDGGFSKLTVVHDQLENSPVTAESVAGGWPMVLSGLKTLLETGKPLTVA